MRPNPTVWILLALAAATSLHAATFLPYLDPVRDEVTHQLERADTAAPPDQKLAVSLKKTLAIIEKPGAATLASDLKLLSVLCATLTTSSVSEASQGPLNQAVDGYLSYLSVAASSSSEKLASIASSKERIAAQQSLDAVFSSLQAAANSTDLSSAVGLLGKAGAKLAATDKLIARANNPTPEPASAKAVVGSSGGEVIWSFKSNTGLPGWASPSTPVNSAHALLLGPSGPQSLPGSNSGGSAAGLRAVVYGNGTDWGYGIAWPSK